MNSRSLSRLAKAGVAMAAAQFLAWAAWAEEPAPPHKSGTGPDIEVHYVLLKGHTNEGMLRQIAEKSLEACRTMGRPVAAKLPEHMTKLERHVYFARQATITYDRAWVYEVGAQCAAAGHWRYTEKADLKTPQGNCAIDFKLKRAASAAAGGCHPDTFLAATTELQPPGDKQDEFIGMRSYAGHACRAYRAQVGGAVSEHCIYVPGGFSPYRANFNWARPAGLNLFVRQYAAGHEDGDSMPQFEAQEVLESIRVSREVFTPHLAADFKVIEGGVK